MDGIPLIYDVNAEDVVKFKNTGEFNNNLDSYGNIQLVFSVAQSMNGDKNYVKVPLKTFEYNELKITDTEQINFTELQTEETVDKGNLDFVLEQYNSHPLLRI